MKRLLSTLLNLSRRIYVGLFTLTMSTMTFAAEEVDLLDVLDTTGAIGKKTGVVTYDWALTIGLILLVLGGLIFVASTRNTGDNSKTKGTAALIFCVGIVFTSLGAFTDIGARTFTKQNSEISTMLGE